MKSFELTTRMTMVKRSSGRSSTAAAAYRSGTKIECEREGKSHDYTRKQGIAATGLILPENSPAMTRSQLWNMAELKENRKNSQTAREYLFSLPSDLSPEGRLSAVKEIGNHLIKAHGVAIDYAIHEPNREGDDRNHHCHMMMTTRRMDRGELTEKTRELDDRKTGPEHAKQLRAFVADVLNRGLVREHGDNRSVNVEHLSFADRGIERTPQQHKGVVLSHAERRDNDAAQFRKVAYAERMALRESHDKQKFDQTIRHKMEARNHRQKWAKEGRERIDTIKLNLEKAERADTPLKGLKWLKSILLRRTARENDARLMRSRDRHDLAGREIEGLRQHYKQQREHMKVEQREERDSLTMKHGKDRTKMEKSLSHKKRYIDIKRETGRDLVKEQRDRRANRPQGIGRSLTP